jgi:hypothetical protein
LNSAAVCRAAPGCYPEFVISSRKFKGILAMGLLLPLALAACHKEEQAVEGVAQNAVKAEHTAQVNATELDQERAQLAQIPLPTKSMYIDVHEPAQWENPFLSVGPQYVAMRILMPDMNPSTATEGTLLRPKAAREQELELRIPDLDKALAALPAGAWHYGRVVAVAESPETRSKDRAAVRRNVETVIRRLNDLGIVVEEWPSR